jgi:hypothetical protein
MTSPLGLYALKKSHAGVTAFVQRQPIVLPELYPMAAGVIAGPAVAMSQLVPAHQSEQATIFFVIRQR